MAQATGFTQRTRLVLLFVDVVLLLAVSRLALGQWLPPGGDKGFWLYTALLGLVLGVRLDTPFFARPADVILFAAPAGLGLLLIRAWDSWSQGVRVLFVVAEAWCVVAFILGVTAIFLKDSKSRALGLASNGARILGESFGAPRVLFTVILGFAAYSFHRSSSEEMGWIILGWLLVGIASLPDAVLRLAGRIARGLRRPLLDADGAIAGFQTPGLVLVRETWGRRIPLGQLLAFNDPAGEVSLGLALDHVGRDEGVLVRALALPGTVRDQDLSRSIAALPPGTVGCIDESAVDDQPEILTSRDALVGLVAPDTSPEILSFDVVQNEEIEEGRLVEVEFRDRRVAYQVLTGLTKEEVVQQKNTHGYVRAQARKIGVWDSQKRLFTGVRWLPQPNSPVRLQQSEDFVPTAEAIGHIPGSSYEVCLKIDGSEKVGLNALVTHNTAILGILGVGKSYLALELVERIAALGVKTVCIDLTDQYAKELMAFRSPDVEERELRRLAEVSAVRANQASQNEDEGGSIREVRSQLKQDLRAFIQGGEKSSPVKVYNPSGLAASRQAGWQDYKTGKAPMAQLTPAEVTQQVVEVVLEIVAEMGMTTDSKARVCIVLEEAHSLVPEYGSVVAKGDQAASNGTARAILQGRKYGLGCLLITQRTANVTKTILNQCNTVFAMRSFDKTSEDFLANYLGRRYAEALPGLPERQAVFFGRASSCENPVLIRLNNREDFTREFRKVHPLPTPTPISADSPLAASNSASEAEDDDIPF